MDTISPTNQPALVPYTEPIGSPKTRWRLMRTLLRRPRPLRQFVPRIDFDPLRNPPDPAVAAHWGEHMLIEDFLIVLHRDGTSSMIRHYVSQLHSAEALAAWDEVSRSYDTRKEKTQIHKALLYLPEGGVRHATKKVHVVAAPDTQPNNLGRLMQYRFSPLRPGVILEFEEQYDEFRLGDFGPHLWSQFYLATPLPCRHRRFTVAVAAPFSLIHEAHHIDLLPTERTHGNYRVYTWEVQPAEGIEWDDWTPPIRDFAPWLDVTTAPSWTPFVIKLRQELEPPRAVPPEIHSLCRELSTGKTSTSEKAIAAYNYVSRTLRYGRPPIESLDRNIRAASQMFDDLRGDCKDKSALLVQLLRLMKMTADIGVVLTADSGRTPFLPSNRFNHAVVRVELDGRPVWLDPAAGLFAFGELPPIDQDIAALVLGTNGYFFECIPAWNGDEYSECRDAEGALQLDGNYDFQATIRFRGDASARLRMQLVDRSPERRRDVLQFWLGNDYPGAVGADFEFDNPEDLSNTFGYKCHALLHRIARRVKNVLLFDVPWCRPLSLSGPLAASTRRQPLVIPPAHHLYERHLIRLPDSVSVYAAPEPVAAQCAWGEYSCTMTPDDGRLVCERRFRLKGRLVPHEHFGEFQEFWRQASWSDTSPIVLQVDESRPT